MAAMGYAILRMEPRTIQGTAAMLRHALREAPGPNAEPGAEPPQVLAGHGTAQAGMAVLLGAMARVCLDVQELEAHGSSVAGLFS